MFGSYRRDDVTLLLKDITGQIEPLGTQARVTCDQYITVICFTIIQSHG